MYLLTTSQLEVRVCGLAVGTVLVRRHVVAHLAEPLLHERQRDVLRLQCSPPVICGLTKKAHPHPTRPGPGPPTTSAAQYATYALLLRRFLKSGVLKSRSLYGGKALGECSRCAAVPQQPRSSMPCSEYDHLEQKKHKTKQPRKKSSESPPDYAPKYSPVP